ncbi:MAG: hypothetical protein ACK5Y2_12955 [Bdellovibrionales bacterium]
MKLFVMLSLFTGLTAHSYNTQYDRSEFGKVNVISRLSKNSQNQVVSLVVDSVSKEEPSQPVVVNSTPTPNLCVYKQTLLSFAGFDMRTKEYLRSYEIQIEVKAFRHGKACTFLIKPAKDSTVQQSARVLIL